MIGDRLPAARCCVHETMDVHHHLAPPAQLHSLAECGLPVPAMTSRWTIDNSLSQMSEAGVQRAVLSIAPPGLGYTDTRSRSLARACNEYAALLASDYPTRFSFFAALPLTDTLSAIAEADYALDRLGADGVILFTNINGKYLGDPHFEPLLDHLNARGAVAFVHPISNQCCSNLVSGIPDTVIEYGAETARTIASLLFSKTAKERNQLRMIYSHAGGAMTALTQRFTVFAQQTGGDDAVKRVQHALRSNFYDTAQSGNKINLTALLQVVPVGQILFGSDYPFLGIGAQLAALSGVGLNAGDLELILSRKAVLFPDNLSGL